MKNGEKTEDPPVTMVLDRVIVIEERAVAGGRLVSEGSQEKPSPSAPTAIPAEAATPTEHLSGA